MIERKANCQGHDGSKGYVRAHKIIVELPLYERGGRRGRGEKKKGNQSHGSCLVSTIATQKLSVPLFHKSLDE